MQRRQLPLGARRAPSLVGVEPAASRWLCEVADGRWRRRRRIFRRIASRIQLIEQLLRGIDMLTQHCSALRARSLQVTCDNSNARSAI